MERATGNAGNVVNGDIPGESVLKSWRVWQAKVAKWQR